LLATQLVSRVRDAFQIELPLLSIFETPTVAGLADKLGATRRAGHVLSIPPLLPVPRDGGLPLSFAQEWMLSFINQSELRDKPFLRLFRAVRLTGSLSEGSLRRSVGEIVRRHEALRTTFGVVHDHPVQVISPTLMLPLPVIDLRKVPEAERRSEVHRIVISEAERPFDLMRGPLVRASLLRLTEREHVFLIAIHHLVFDGWSENVLFKELSALYEAYCNNQSSPLPELPIQYADFASWERDWLKGEALEGELEYWRTRLAGTSVLRLPTDRLHPAVPSFRSAQQSFTLARSLTNGLKDLSRQERATPFMTLLAALNALLHHYTGQDDVIVGAPSANRSRAETEALIGFFVNTLALRTDLSGNPTFRNLLRRVREGTLGAYAHAALHIVQVERALGLDLRFPVMLDFQDSVASKPLRLPGLTAEFLDVEISTLNRRELSLFFCEKSGCLAGSVVYNPDLFCFDTVSRMLTDFRILLEAVVADPEKRLSELGGSNIRNEASQDALGARQSSGA